MEVAKKMVLRTVYISPELDDLLRVKAFRERTSKNDLIRNYVVAGMRAEAEATQEPDTLKSAVVKEEVKRKVPMVVIKPKATAKADSTVNPKARQKKAHAEAG